MSRLVFLGTSDAFNAAGRGNSCYWIEDELGTYAVDFGPTAMMQCHRLDLNIDQLDGIFLTHLHGDHIGGIAMLLVHLQFECERTRPFVIAGPPGTEARINMLRESAYPSVVSSGLNYPLKYVTWTVPGETEALGRTVRTIRAKHDRVAVATSFVVKTDRRQIAFSGDTGWQPELAALVDGVDYFVCECTNLTGDYWAHLCVEEHLEHRDKFRVGRLFLSHLSESARAMAHQHMEGLRATIADDGLSVDLDTRRTQ